jgi:hypothetical protein
MKDGDNSQRCSLQNYKYSICREIRLDQSAARYLQKQIGQTYLKSIYVTIFKTKDRIKLETKDVII